MKKMLKSKKGFSLIELLIVIAILAVLAAISINLFGGVLNNQKAKSDLAACSYLQTAIQTYIADTDDNDLSKLWAGGGRSDEKSAKSIIDQLSKITEVEIDGVTRSYGPYLNSKKATLSTNGKYFKIEINTATQVVKVTPNGTSEDEEATINADSNTAVVT